MSDHDTAATVEDGSFESHQSGANLKHLSKNLRAEIQRRALQSGPEKKQDDIWAFWERVQNMGYKTLQEPFVSLQLDDLRKRDVGECGIFSTLVYSTFFAMAETISWRKWRDVVYTGFSPNLNSDNDSGEPGLAAA